jgi:hypothetical protein
MLSNVEREKLVIDLYYNQRKNVRQIAQEARISFRAIADILKKKEEVVDRLVAELKSLLNSALVAVVEALRMNPDRYVVIYNSKYDNNDNIFESSTGTTAADISSSHYSTISNQNYYNEYHDGIIEIANSFLKILLNQIVDNTMVAAVNQFEEGIKDR